VQWRARGRAVGQPETNPARTVAALAAGAGVLVCLMAFGPVAPSNDSPLATGIMRVLLQVLPPLASVREFHRIWILGVLLLSVSATASLGARMRGRSPVVRAGVALVLTLGALVSVLHRDALAVVDITPPAGLVALASRAPHAGPIYVHPQMEWNTMPGVWMIPAARELRQPIVNGYLGIAPPWFIYAGRVLGRFPAPEAVWLLRHWHVTTVVSVVGDVDADGSAFVTKVFEDPRGAVYDIATAEGALAHPSGGRCLPSDGGVRVAASFVAERGDGGTTLAVTGPGGLATSALEVAFRPSVIEDMPTALLVYPVHGDGDALLGGPAREEAPLNAGLSGDWIESLAADALLARQSPVATVHLAAPTEVPFRIFLRGTSSPPVERITLCGNQRR
jgi:hypothetical protein